MLRSMVQAHLQPPLIGVYSGLTIISFRRFKIRPGASRGMVTPTILNTNAAPGMTVTTLVRKSMVEKPARTSSPGAVATPTNSTGGTSAAAMATPESIAERFGRAMA